MNTIHLPQVSMQHDIQSVIDDVTQGIVQQEDVWISCYQQDTPSVHGKARVSLSKDGLVLRGRDGVNIERLSPTAYTVDCPQIGIERAVLRTPLRSIGETKTQVVPKAIHSFDIAPNGTLYATGHPDGSIQVGPVDASRTSTPNPKESSPHVSNILSLRFFPSSEVILTASVDMSLSIISAIDLSVPRKLKGHSRAVTDTAIIERGRNVVSCGKDGTVRLWDVGGGKQIKMMGVDSYSPVLKMAVGVMNDEILMPPPMGEEPSSPTGQASRNLIIGPSEIGTEDKLVCCALQNGRFTLIDLGSKRSVFTSKTTLPSAANATQMQGKDPALFSIAYSPSHRLLATGSIDGKISLFDTRALETPLFSLRRNGACIEDIAFVSPVLEGSTADLVVATQDGMPFRVSVGPEKPAVVEEYLGYDCDAVRGVKVVSGSVWMAGDDGVIRKY